ncbi:MAG TPA: nitrilase-related carbon-nitrogen hydrolase [Humisphaera sp.]|jgi:apolipoprotein N-acyltransferase|nr:nitrilase-related carbon-nitrogen hydrolase [Humisphaera sp.]
MQSQSPAGVWASPRVQAASDQALSERPVLQTSAPVSITDAIALCGCAALANGIAFATPSGAAAILVILPCLCLLGRLLTARRSFYFGLLAGILMYAPHLAFFWKIFAARSILLWLIAGFPIGIVILLLYHSHRRLGATWAMLLTPILWTGVEYFRSEAYYLKFAWLLPGQAAAFLPGVGLARVGVYGLGFIYAMLAAMIVGRSALIRTVGLAASIVLGILMYLPIFPAGPHASPLHVAGIQLESPTEAQAAAALDHLAIAHPEAQILVLSEYTFTGPVPQSVREVIRKHGRYLVASGIRLADGGDFHDTAFVIDPEGRDVFEQAKSVPVQFMGDGLAATQRRVWESPWGKIGIAICYDIGYSRAMDEFVRQGAQALIIPTMDLRSWGLYERRMLHGRLAPIRSVEYGIPIFGVWSSGESQLTDRFGKIIAKAGYPGQGAIVYGPLRLESKGHLPPDRPLAIGAMYATYATGLYILVLIVWRTRGHRA